MGDLGQFLLGGWLVFGLVLVAVQARRWVIRRWPNAWFITPDPVGDWRDGERVTVTRGTVRQPFHAFASTVRLETRDDD